MSKSTSFATGLIFVGLALLGLSYVWPLIVSQDLVWSKEQATENAQASAGLHEMTHMAAHSDISKDSPAEKEQMKLQLEKAQQRFSDSRAKLDRARNVRQTAAQVLRWGGISLAVIGVIYSLASRSEGDQRRPRKRRTRSKTTDTV
ncbi:MAG: hypothetical protein GY768_07195 [Planctomycetaceae bacterium]|nr:hypothetical protein [Planctomycetaceae bacterium]